MKNADKFITLVSALLMLSSIIPLSASVGGAPDTWTFMVYMDADNELEPYATDNFMQMSEVGSSVYVKIIVQIDRIAIYDTTYSWSNCRRFNVAQGSTLASTPVQTIGEVNMGDPATLVNFVTWASAAYPANHFVLILWDHGGDWAGACYDETSNDLLELTEISSALSAIRTNIGGPLDIVGFDACSMGSVEVGYQIRANADYFVASEAGTPLLGFAYDSPLTALTNNPSMTPVQFGNEIVAGYYDFYTSLTGTAKLQFNQSITLSTVDLGAIDPIVSSLKNLSYELRTNMGQWVNHVAIARNLTEAYDGVNVKDAVDLYDLMDNLRSIIPNATIHALVNEVIDSLNASIKGSINVSDPFGVSEPVDNAHGMSVYFPESSYGYDPDYGSISPFNFTADSQWASFLFTYYNKALTGNPTVMYVSPSGENASLTGNIEVQFSEPMNTTTLAGAFSISPSTAGILGWDAASINLTFNPSSPLSPLTSYIVRINTSATDLSGNHVPANTSWAFTTEAFNTSCYADGELGDNCWYISALNVTLETNAPGAVNWTVYRLNGGNWTNYSSPIGVDSEGSNLVEYHSQTLTGYEDQVKNATFMIDLNAPNSSANVSDSKVTITSSDNLSGVNWTKCRVDGGAWQMYSDAFYINSSGNHKVEYYSIDMAGNVELVKTVWVSGSGDFLSLFGLLIVIVVILVVAMVVAVYMLMRRRPGAPNEGEEPKQP